MSIQKQVEVDQAERDRHIQEKQQKLQDHIQAVGVGIAGGAIVASSSGLLFEPQPMTFPWQAEFGRYPHPFLSAFAISSLVAYFAFKAAKYWIEKGRSL